jgi:ATP-dependent exoDNAse (exonuclease V) beta subunit
MKEFQKNLLLLASAGSGKTFRLSDRIIELAARGADPEHIVALTFTRKAAGEFADALLKKLAEAAQDPQKAADLAERTMPTDFGLLLERMVRSLPKLTLGTMDAFFAKIVRGFQYELGIAGGKFELLEGEAASAARKAVMEELLDGGLDPETGEEFVNIFRQATGNKEGTTVLNELEEFIGAWHGVYLSSGHRAWGPAELMPTDVTDWERCKHDLIATVRHDWPHVEITDKRQQHIIEPILETFAKHTIGSGLLGSAKGLVDKIMNAVRGTEGDIEISHYKPMKITGSAAQALRKLVDLAARCEFSAALQRTRGIHGVIRKYDEWLEKELRSRGKLGFDDVKRLMSAWIRTEDARLRREAVDFRLDATYQHWLLDEFQDTSQDEWDGLKSLVDEAVTGEGSSLFVVGDKKQAIYAWRGGKVGLFDELIRTYSDHDERNPLSLKQDTMVDSHRSCPQVLELVNRVCGDVDTLRNLFGSAADAWCRGWQDHVSAERVRRSSPLGFSYAEVTPKDEMKQRVIAQMEEIGIGCKPLSCGVLLSKNEQVREWADELRAKGFQVVEEGVRKPGQDHPVGLMIWKLLGWLADPSDAFAKQTILMSPLGDALNLQYGGDWHAAWEALGCQCSKLGFSETVRTWLTPLAGRWGPFGTHRLEDLLQCLKKMDDEGVILAREAADRIGRMEISQSPGVAAVQVMTIHKSKGLGFDVVFLPEISNDTIPSLQHFRRIVTDDWITAAPPAWVRNRFPPLAAAETAWVGQQIYEALCKLYVALTRAKRGVYLYLTEPSKSADDDKSSYSSWIMNSLKLDPTAGSTFEHGQRDWYAALRPREKPKAMVRPVLKPGKNKRARTTPSRGKEVANPLTAGDGTARLRGIAVHRALEAFGWIDDSGIPECSSEVAQILGPLFSVPEIRDLFSRKGQEIRLYREQRIEAVIDDTWMSGVMDRLHVHLHEGGKADRVDIIDFKTDRVADAAALRERYADQLKSYHAAVSRIYPEARIRCLMISTALNQVVTWG